VSIRKPNPWSATNAPEWWCSIHGQAFTYGCPGCEEAAEYLDDVACAEEVRRRTRWWKLSEACGRFWPHWWRELEPTVHRCRICRCTRFEAATIEQFHRWLA